MVKHICSILIILIAIIIGYFVSHFVQLGALKSITADDEHGNQDCEILTQKETRLTGCEDIARFNDGRIILSCLDRTHLFEQHFSSKDMTQIIEQSTNNGHKGYLFTMSHINAQIDNENEFVELELLNRVSPDFQPHGVSVITDYANAKWIFVINHRRDGDVVEIYQLSTDQTKATLVDEVHSPLFVFINDLKSVLLPRAPDNGLRIGFYVTNSMGFRPNTKLNTMESLLGLKTNDLVFCEPDTRKYDDQYNTYKPQWSCRIVDRNLGFGNGVDMSVDGKQLYVVETFPPNIIVYERDEGTNALARNSSIGLSGLVDNLYLDEDSGDLFIGCHPNVVQFMQYAMRGATTAPSQVLHWNKATGQVSQIYLSNAHSKYHVSASSVGVFDAQSKLLLIGTVNGGTMRCSLSWPQEEGTQ
eukprot:349005_1